MKTKFLSSSPIKISIDKKVLQKNIFVDGEKIIISTLRPIVAQRVKEEQDRMLDEFEDHPVTKEIREGNYASNTSGLLGGYGNLFSFIGFDEGSDPISPISLLLKKKISYIIRRTNDRGGYLITVNSPSKSDLENIAQVSWMGGRSWLDGIEKGIAGLNRYLYDENYGFENSRSETGIQVKKAVRGVSQEGTEYVSKILKDFKSRISQF